MNKTPSSDMPPPHIRRVIVDRRVARCGWTCERLLSTVVALLVLLLECACGIFAGEREWVPTETITDDLCFATTGDPPRQASPLQELANGEAFGLSGRPAAIARALRLFPLLEDRRQLQGQEEQTSAMHLIAIERRIASRLKVASLHVIALSAQVNCEGGRARELADSLGRNKDRSKDRKTITAILAGAATKVLTGIFSIVDMAVTGGAVGIAGGLTQYGFQGAKEEVDVSIDYRHKHNFLQELWNAPEDPKLFPAAVWEFLTYHDGDQPSLRERTLAQWRLGRNVVDDQSDAFKQRYGVLFEEGGTYNLSQLRARAAMLELLRSSIELMQADLAVLVEHLEEDSDLLVGR